MINEFYMLSRSLEDNGISVPIEHPWIEGVRKGEALLVKLSPKGEVHGLEYCSPDRVALFWNIKKSNKHTFPKINLDPLWGELPEKYFLEKIADAAKQRDKAHWLALASELVQSQSELACKETQKIKNWKKDKWTRLYDFPHQEILPRLKSGNQGLIRLIHCFGAWKNFTETQVDSLFIQIALKLVKNLKNSRLDCFSLAQTLIAGNPNAKTQPQVTVIFDCSEGRAVAADEVERLELNSALSGHKACGGEKYKCALTGEMVGSVADKFPSPKLPILGNAFLMSMNKDSPCHSRYGRIGADIFPASFEVCARLDNVARYITAPDRKEKTWMSVTSGKWEGNPKKEKRDLLIAYAQGVPGIEDQNVALALGGDSDSEMRFEAVSSTVCDALRKHWIPDADAKINFFIIRNISPGQSQTILNDTCTVPQLIDAVAQWQMAAQNHPRFGFYLPKSRGEKAERQVPFMPFLADFPRLMQFQWIREGTESHKIDGPALAGVFDLFFDRGARTRSAAGRALGLMLSRLGPLLAGIGRAQHAADSEVLGGYSVPSKKTGLQAVAWLGIVLFKIGYKKEVYMKEVGYNVGKMLSMADCLHREYCRFVRNKEIPNQLLGNMFLRTAMDNPAQGIARLAERIGPYKAWIDKSFGEQFRLAHWALNQMGIVSNNLADKDLPQSSSDALKAQILLGYLAHTEPKQQKPE